MKAPIRIELPMLQPKLKVNTYLFLEPEPVLIDCGMNTEVTWDIIGRELRKHGLEMSDLQQVYITHAHIDHMGLSGRLAVEAGARIWVNPYTLAWAQDLEVMWRKRAGIIRTVLAQEAPPDWDNPILANMEVFFQQAMACWSDIPTEAIQVYQIGDSLSFGGGEWKVLYVPGHSNTQTCFYEPKQQWLFSADMLLPLTPTPAIEMQVDQESEREISIIRLLESFARMRALPITQVFPGHGAPFGQHQQLIDNQVARIHWRKDECLRVIQQGHHLFYEIFQRVYPNAFNIFTLSMLKGYLDLLEVEEKIQVETRAGYRQYQAKHLVSN